MVKVTVEADFAGFFRALEDARKVLASAHAEMNDRVRAAAVQMRAAGAAALAAAAALAETAKSVDDGTGQQERDGS